jgi:hypothetical protein
MRGSENGTAMLEWARAKAITHADAIYRCLIAALALAAIAGMLGGTWDAAWHVTLRRETFWSPPHLLLYAGTTLSLMIGAAAMGGAFFLRWPTPGPWIVLFGRRLPLGFAVAAGGAAIVLGAAPLDDFWHRTFGADVDVWSFPHLVALFGGAFINIGAVMAIGAHMRTIIGPPLGHRAVMLLFLSVLVWLSMFSLNWYTLVLARWRDSFQYPILLGLVAPVALVIAARAFGRGGATLAALGYTVYTAAAHFGLNGVGYALLPFPPLLLVPAVMLDLLLPMRWGHGWQRAIVAGLLFAPVFVAAEAASLAWFPHPYVNEPPAGPLALGYFLAALERPWQLDPLLRTLPLMAGGSALSALLGWWIGALTRRAQEDPGPVPGLASEPLSAPEGATYPRLLPQ